MKKFNQKITERKMNYINKKGRGELETIHEFKNLNETMKCLQALRELQDNNIYYIPDEPCKNWKDTTNKI